MGCTVFASDGLTMQTMCLAATVRFDGGSTRLKPDRAEKRSNCYACSLPFAAGCGISRSLAPIAIADSRKVM